MRGLSILEASHFMDDSILVIGVKSNPTVAEELDRVTSLQALARLRFSKTVAQSDVDEALRLMQMSKFSLYYDYRQKSGLDAISEIYSILRDEAARTNKLDISYADALNWISRKVKESLCMLENLSSTISTFDLEQEWKNFGEIKPEGVVIRTCKVKTCAFFLPKFLGS
ncbi:hypothetical protein IFM89_032289 [Coptis chinensis]|uniref:Uncharacterized protein n=1 Tax=Coptis chinensis TaxID=261450 RepID=A0A835GZ63_9MAGN|nr:hypothetical protein IFM89_032289 [Coptis chinensis]